MDFEKILQMEALKETVATKEVVRKEPTALRGFDTRAVMADLSAMEVKCTALINEAEALVIKTPEQNMEAVNISGDLQELTKNVKKKCEDFLEPYKRVTSAINGPKKRIIDAATSAKSIVNQKIVQYGKQAEIDMAKQQKVIDEATEKLQASLKEQAKELGIKAPTVAPIKAPKPVTILRGDSGASVYTQSRWKVEIVNPELVAREYCVPSITLLNQAVKMGKRDLAGCRVYKDEKPVTRSA